MYTGKKLVTGQLYWLLFCLTGPRKITMIAAQRERRERERENECMCVCVCVCVCVCARSKWGREQADRTTLPAEL